MFYWMRNEYWDLYLFDIYNCILIACECEEDGVIICDRVIGRC